MISSQSRLTIISLIVYSLVGCEQNNSSPSPSCLDDRDQCGEQRDQEIDASQMIQDMGSPADQSSPEMSLEMDLALEADARLMPEPFTQVVMDQEPIYSYGETNFQNALARLDLGSGPFSEVTLKVTLHTSCYPFESWADDPPPEGQNWPPSCDAFDRNFELLLKPIDPQDAEEDVAHEFEVMRAITPFGGPAEHTLDLTDYANAHEGLHQARVRITTWSDGAGQVSGSQGMWKVSIEAHVTPGPAPRQVIDVLSIFNRTLRAADGPLEVPFTTPDGVRSARLEYRTTGHGGGMDPSPRCIGPAEEFCQREHILGVDGRDLETITPWRDDCELGCTLTRFENGGNNFEYCLENPMGDQRSVRAPRANWCPGSLTPPISYEVPSFTIAGEHSFYVEIPNLHPDGMWRVSALVYLYGE